MSRIYEVRHVTSYRYAAPVTASYGRAHVVPRAGGGQQPISREVTITPEPTLVRESEDFYGNRSLYYELHDPHTELDVAAVSRVRIERQAPDADLLGDLDWARAAQQIDELLETSPDDVASAGIDLADSELDPASDPAAAELLRITDFRLPSKHVPITAGVREFAREVFTPHRPVWDAVNALVSTIYADFAYRPGSTSVSTTLEQVLSQRAGVCQDFAHLAVAALRSVGLPARYVSGYLETMPPPGQPKLVGADASHAWASVFLPGAGWVDIDPTNDKVVDDTYVLTAWGRDYADVPPLKGVIFTEGRKTTLSVAVDVVRVPEPTAASPGPSDTGHDEESAE